MLDTAYAKGTFLYYKDVLNGRLSKRLQQNTYVHEEAGRKLAIRYHSTDILVLAPDGTITLYSGGWRTMSTKDRLNAYLPAGCYITQDKKIWTVHINVGTENAQSRRFCDGISIHMWDDGRLAFVGETPDLSEEDAENARRDKLIKKYVAGLTEEVARKALEDMRGDCWYCQMVVQEGGEDRALGDKMGDHSHLLSHIEERYYVGSMICNAYRARGFPKPDRALSLDLQSYPQRLQAIVRDYLQKRLLTGLAGGRP